MPEESIVFCACSLGVFAIVDSTTNFENFLTWGTIYGDLARYIPKLFTLISDAFFCNGREHVTSPKIEDLARRRWPGCHQGSGCQL